jgi:hypothetical protein
MNAEITDRDLGSVRGVNVALPRDIPLSIGQHVRISGSVYEITNIEYVQALVSPPFIKPDVSLGLKPVKQDE